MVLGVPGARDRRGVRAEWKEEKEAVLVRALEKGKPDSSPSCHGGGEVAADRGVRVAWQGREKSNARGSRRRVGLGKKTREPRTEPKLPRTDTEGTGTEEVRFLFGSMI